ncbi:MAG: DNA internalization-related competence protein ComEC/Rec2 [Myxococcaceae bacterium]
MHDATAGALTLFLLLTPAFFLFAFLRGARVGGHLAVLAGSFCLGAGLAASAAKVEIPSGLATAGGTVRVEGQVETVSERPGYWQLELAVSRVNQTAVRFRARLSSNRPVPWLPDQRVVLDARLKPAEGPSNWGEADTASSLRRKGVVFTGSFDPARSLTLDPPSRWRAAIESQRQKLAESVRALAPTPQSAALFLTLAAGLRASLGDELEETFSRSGLAHVLSVSGLHVAALALMLLKLLRTLLTRGSARDVRRLAAPLSIPLVWLYVVFTGTQAPAVRSALMASLLLVALSLWRRADPLNGLAFAAVGIVSVDPSAVSALSLQLSFLAVLSLLLLSPALRALIPVAEPDPSRPHYPLQRLRESLIGTFCASAAVTVGSLPLIASTFHRLSVAGLFSNIVALPVCAGLTALAAGGATLHAVSPGLAKPVLVAGVWTSQALLKIADAFAAMPFAALKMPSLGGWLAVLFAVGLGAFALARGRWRLVGALAPVSLLLAFAPVTSLETTVTFLSVGHGDAIVISSRGEHALIDGGGVPGGADTGRRFVLPYLRELGVEKLELAALSHPHPDHALGLASVLRELPADRLWLPKDAGAGPLTRAVREPVHGLIEEVEAGHSPLRLGEVSLEALGPPVDRALLEGVNDQSLVLLARHHDVTFLLTGDIEAAGEETLRTGPVTVLKAPHHGSRTSSTPSFVDAARPQFVVFCVGRHNRFGFPHSEVVDRYKGARCLRPDLHGAVRFHSDGQSVRVETFLHGKEVANAPVATEFP